MKEKNNFQDFQDLAKRETIFPSDSIKIPSNREFVFPRLKKISKIRPYQQ